MLSFGEQGYAARHRQALENAERIRRKQSRFSTTSSTPSLPPIHSNSSTQNTTRCPSAVSFSPSWTSVESLPSIDRRVKKRSPGPQQREVGMRKESAYDMMHQPPPKYVTKEIYHTEVPCSSAPGPYRQPPVVEDHKSDDRRSVDDATMLQHAPTSHSNFPRSFDASTCNIPVRVNQPRIRRFPSGQAKQVDPSLAETGTPQNHTPIPPPPRKSETGDHASNMPSRPQSGRRRFIVPSTPGNQSEEHPERTYRRSGWFKENPLEQTEDTKQRLRSRFVRDREVEDDVEGDGGTILDQMEQTAKRGRGVRKSSNTPTSRPNGQCQSPPNEQTAKLPLGEPNKQRKNGEDNEGTVMRNSPTGPRVDETRLASVYAIGSQHTEHTVQTPPSQRYEKVLGQVLSMIFSAEKKPYIPLRLPEQHQDAPTTSSKMDPAADLGTIMKKTRSLLKENGLVDLLPKSSRIANHTPSPSRDPSKERIPMQMTEIQLKTKPQSPIAKNTSTTSLGPTHDAKCTLTNRRPNHRRPSGSKEISLLGGGRTLETTVNSELAPEERSSINSAENDEAEMPPHPAVMCSPTFTCIGTGGPTVAPIRALDACYMRDGDRVFAATASSNPDKKISIWSLPLGPEMPDGMDFASPSSSFAAATSPRLYTQLDNMTSKSVSVISFHPTYPHLILTADMEFDVKLWNWWTGQLIRTWRKHHRRIIHQLGVVPGCPDRAVSCSGDHSVKLWSIDRDPPPFALPGGGAAGGLRYAAGVHANEPFTAFTFSGKRQHQMLVAATAYSLRAYKVRTLGILWTAVMPQLKASKTPITSLCSHPLNDRFVLLSSDCQARMYDLSARATLRVYNAREIPPGNRIRAHFSPCGGYVYSGGGDIRGGSSYSTGPGKSSHSSRRRSYDTEDCYERNDKNLENGLFVWRTHSGKLERSVGFGAGGTMGLGMHRDGTFSCGNEIITECKWITLPGTTQGRKEHGVDKNGRTQQQPRVLIAATADRMVGMYT